MLIEAISGPIRYSWPRGKIDLIPGQPVEVSPERGAKILKRCGAKVRVTPTRPPPANVQAIEPAPESLAFDLNANLSLEGQTPLKEGSIPSGANVSFQSPLFGDLQGIVIEDRGAVVWVWHPLRECECCIPRGWIAGWGEDR